MEPSPSPSPAPSLAASDRHLVTTPEVACDGGGGALGHPLVYLAFGKATEIVCPYCSRHYVRTGGAKAGSGH